jgi:hypothetical protein
MRLPSLLRLVLGLLLGIDRRSLFEWQASFQRAQYSFLPFAPFTCTCRPTAKLNFAITEKEEQEKKKDKCKSRGKRKRAQQTLLRHLNRSLVSQSKAQRIQLLQEHGQTLLLLLPLPLLQEVPPP